MSQLFIYTLLISCSLLTPLVSLMLSAPTRRWKTANASSLVGLFSALAIWLLTIFKVDVINAFDFIHFTGVTSTVLLLVHFIGYVVLKYAQQNFELDPDNKRFLQWFLITLASGKSSLTNQQKPTLTIKPKN